MADESVRERVARMMGLTWPTDRCPVCGWDYADNMAQGCVPENCSLRPRPDSRADEPPAYEESVEASRDVLNYIRQQPWPVPDKFLQELYDASDSGMSGPWKCLLATPRAICEAALAVGEKK